MTIDDQLSSYARGQKPSQAFNPNDRRSIDEMLAGDATRILQEEISFCPPQRQSQLDFAALQTKYGQLESETPAQEPSTSSYQPAVAPRNFKQSHNSANANGQREKANRSMTFNISGNIFARNQPCSPEEPSTSAALSHHQQQKVSDGIAEPAFHIYNGKINLDWSHYRPPRGHGIGLQNNGNTCFLNSVLQALTHTPPLLTYLVQEHIKCAYSQHNFCGFCEMRGHVLTTVVSPPGPSYCGDQSISPSRILQRVRLIMKSYQRGRQEDAHEFLRYFVDALQNSALLPHKGKKLDMHTKSTTVIGKIFGGYTRSEISCNRCTKKSTTYDFFLDLSLDLKARGMPLASLDDTLKQYTKVEMLTGENAYKCQHCRTNVQAKKQCTVHRAPNVLTLQLKRFDHYGKISNKLSIKEKLNLRPYMSENSGPPVLYKLFAVIVHQGNTTHSGHYYAIVRNMNIREQDRFVMLDDNRVCDMKVQTVLNQQHYLLFYSRVPTPAAAVKPQARAHTLGIERPLHKPAVIVTQRKPVSTAFPKQTHTVPPFAATPSTQKNGSLKLTIRQNQPGTPQSTPGAKPGVDSRPIGPQLPPSAERHPSKKAGREERERNESLGSRLAAEKSAKRPPRPLVDYESEGSNSSSNSSPARQSPPTAAAKNIFERLATLPNKGQAGSESPSDRKRRHPPGDSLYEDLPAPKRRLSMDTVLAEELRANVTVRQESGPTSQTSDKLPSPVLDKFKKRKRERLSEKEDGGDSSRGGSSSGKTSPDEPKAASPIAAAANPRIGIKLNLKKGRVKLIGDDEESGDAQVLDVPVRKVSEPVFREEPQEKRARPAADEDADRGHSESEIEQSQPPADNFAKWDFSDGSQATPNGNCGPNEERSEKSANQERKRKKSHKHRDDSDQDRKRDSVERKKRKKKKKHHRKHHSKRHSDSESDRHDAHHARKESPDRTRRDSDREKDISERTDTKDNTERTGHHQERDGHHKNRDSHHHHHASSPTRHHRRSWEHEDRTEPDDRCGSSHRRFSEDRTTYHHYGGRGGRYYQRNYHGYQAYGDRRGSAGWRSYDRRYRGR